MEGEKDSLILTQKGEADLNLIGETVFFILIIVEKESTQVLMSIG